LSALASWKEDTIDGYPTEGVASREEDEEGGCLVWETGPLDWYATDTTPWFRVKNSRPPLCTPAVSSSG